MCRSVPSLYQNKNNWAISHKKCDILYLRKEWDRKKLKESIKMRERDEKKYRMIYFYRIHTFILRTKHVYWFIKHSTYLYKDWEGYICLSERVFSVEHPVYHTLQNVIFQLHLTIVDGCNVRAIDVNR